MPQNKIDECLFCGQVSCRCGKPPVKSAKPSRPAKPASLARPPAPAVIPSAKSTFAAPAKTEVTFSSVRTDEDREMSRALTVLADAEILSVEDLRRIRPQLDLTPARIDLLIWKAEGYAN